ncbi:MAG: hypothetical protein R3A79_01400 [Nannocystaceae bacterium]
MRPRPSRTIPRRRGAARLAGRTAAALLALVVGGALGCLGTSDFRCDGDLDCDLRAEGRCEATRYCSYPDTTCPLGRRYADAGELGEACVGATGATGSTSETGTSAGTDTTGATDTTGTGAATDLSTTDMAIPADLDLL